MTDFYSTLVEVLKDAAFELGTCLRNSSELRLELTSEIMLSSVTIY